MFVLAGAAFIFAALLRAILVTRCGKVNRFSFLLSARPGFGFDRWHVQRCLCCDRAEPVAVRGIGSLPPGAGANPSPSCDCEPDSEARSRSLFLAAAIELLEREDSAAVAPATLENVENGGQSPHQVRTENSVFAADRVDVVAASSLLAAAHCVRAAAARTPHTGHGERSRRRRRWLWFLLAAAGSVAAVRLALRARAADPGLHRLPQALHTALPGEWSALRCGCCCLQHAVVLISFLALMSRRRCFVLVSLASQTLHCVPVTPRDFLPSTTGEPHLPNYTIRRFESIFPC